MKKQIKEIPSILFLMISFGVAIRVMTGGKEEVPLHWNVLGEIDSWGDTWTIVLLPVIALALYGLLTLLQRRPQWYNYPCKITDKAGAYKLMSGMLGHIKNFVMLLFLYITLAVAQIIELNTFVLLLVALAIPFIIRPSKKHRDTRQPNQKEATIIGNRFLENRSNFLDITTIMNGMARATSNSTKVFSSMICATASVI